MLPTPVPSGFVGRQGDRQRLRNLLSDVSGGRGGSVLVEGEPGIGKSALLTDAFTDADALGCEVAWATADELSQRLPLRVLLDCLGVTARAADTDPERAEIAAALRGPRGGGLIGDGDPVRAATERLLAFVERWATRTPLVLVIDDLQWADDASLAAWKRLAETVEQVPVLLAAAYRPVPQRAVLDQVRNTMRAHAGLVIVVQPLDEVEVTELVTDLVGGPPDAGLRRLAGRAAGNPLYVRELVNAVLRDNTRQKDTAQKNTSRGWDAERAPASVTAAITRRLGFLSPAVSEVLRTGALLGGQFSPTDVAVVLGRPAEAITPLVDEAVTAGVLVRTDQRLTFRHPLIRQALYDDINAGVRAALHRHAAAALAAAGAAPVDVAAQLVAAPGPLEGWTADWLAADGAALTNRAPQIAVELLQRVLAWLPATDARHGPLAATLAALLFRLGQNAEAETYAKAAIDSGDPDRTARMRWLLAYLHMRTGRFPEAMSGLREALDDERLPARWRARLLALAAMMRAVAGTDLDGAEESARGALALGEGEGDRFAIGWALQSLSTVYAVRRDEPGRLACVDRALDVLGDDPEYTDLRLLHLANRMYSLTVLDRMAEAETTLASLRALAERFGDARLASLHHPAATLYFFVGRWDDALVELAGIADVPEDRALTGMVHGLAALIAARRDDRAAAAAHLSAVRDEPLDTPGARANSLPLLTARAVAAERDGDPARALAVLLPLLDVEYAQSERHLLLPELVRLAVAIGDLDAARRAVEICAAIAEAAPTASRWAAVDRCRGMLDGDPAPVLAAAEHYRAVGRVPELGNALEDAAVLLGRRGDPGGARTAFVQAVECYGQLGAAWDLRRTDSRIRPYGIRRGSRGPRRRPRYGWEALSPTERVVADLVASGRSNPDIAAELLLSRRTVQSHVSNILVKLSARSRVEIAREAVRHAAG